jgi:hypothetical protein
MQALRLTAVGERPPLALELPPSTSFDEWVRIGRNLCLSSQALNWHIGDWWAFGDHRYGDRAQSAAEGIFGREFQTLANLATVSRAVETSRRREHLSWTHHAEVASLPAEEADELLARAEREHLSTRALRCEVQARKAANDVGSGQEPEPQPSKPAPTQTIVADLREAYETVIEFGTTLQLLRPLTKREQRLLDNAVAFVKESRAGHRPCPEDFDVIFVERGRLECEVWYRASRWTVSRWMIERGKTRLVAERAAFIRHLRDERRAKQPKRAVAVETGPIDEALQAIARKAASFLRISRYGGWMITASPDGSWLVGTVRKTSDQIIAMAERQGFDSETMVETW